MAFQVVQHLSFLSALKAPRSRISQRAARRAASIGLCLLIWLGCVWLYTRGNTFPNYYHPDEEAKAKQALRGSRNYNHPQLLLEVAGLVVRFQNRDGSEEDNLQRATVLGRWTSAGFAAAAVVGLSLVGLRVGGMGGLLAICLSTGLCPSLLVYAHYFKEDTALLFGLALVVFAGCLLADALSMTRDRSLGKRHGAALSPVPGVYGLGAACGIACAGKYVGLSALGFAFPLLWVWRKHLSRRAARGFVLAFAITFLLVNWRIIDHGRTWVRHIGQQIEDGVLEHKGITMARPTSYFLHAVMIETPPAVLALCALAAILLLVTRRRRNAWDVAVVVFPIAYLALMSFGSAPNHRHVLPVIVMAHFLSGLGVLWLVQLLVRDGLARRVVPVAFAAVMTAFLAPRCADFLRQFRHDSREKVGAWAAGHLPATAVLLQDGGVAFGEPAPGVEGERRGPAGFKVQSYNFAPEIGPFDTLLGLGITHVAVCDVNYDRYFDPHVIPTAAFAEEFARRRQWYARLFREGDLLWQSEPSHPMYGSTNPTIRVYRLKPSSASGT